MEWTLLKKPKPKPNPKPKPKTSRQNQGLSWSGPSFPRLKNAESCLLPRAVWLGCNYRKHIDFIPRLPLAENRVALCHFMKNSVIEDRWRRSELYCFTWFYPNNILLGFHLILGCSLLFTQRLDWHSGAIFLSFPYMVPSAVNHVTHGALVALTSSGCAWEMKQRFPP